MITTANYYDSTKNIDWNAVPASLRKMHETLIPDASKSDWKAFNSDADVKRVVEKYFGYIGKYATVSKGTSSGQKTRHEPKPRKAKSSATDKRTNTKKAIDLPEASLVTYIPTATAFIKRYAGLHGKVKTRDQILSLTHGLQKAITEQRIKSGSPAIAEIEKMQAELIELASTMGESAKIEIDATSLAHYKQIAMGEEVRTSVKLLKSFIAMTGKAYDIKKAASLLKRMETAAAIIPKEDAYRNQLIIAMKELSVYVQGKTKTVGIPSAGLHGIGVIATGSSVSGLGLTHGSGKGTIVDLLKAQGINNLSDAAMKKAFRHTLATSLCLEVAKSLIRRGELSNASLNASQVKKKSYSGSSSELAGVATIAPSETGHITDLEILELRLRNQANSIGRAASLGNVETSSVSRHQNLIKDYSAEPAGNVDSERPVSAAELKNMKFVTLGFKPPYLQLLGDPAPGFACMIYGKPFKGKSTFALLFADYLAKNHGKVLYCTVEEGITRTVQEKAQRLNIGSDRLYFDKAVPVTPSAYDFLIIDSVNDSKLDSTTLRQMKKDNPKTAFIYVFQATKSGGFRGENTFAHDMDIIINVGDDGIARTEKARFGGGSEIKAVPDSK